MCLNSPFRQQKAVSILYKVISYWWLLSLLQYSIDYKTVDQCSESQLNLTELLRNQSRAYFQFNYTCLCLKCNKGVG